MKNTQFFRGAIIATAFTLLLQSAGWAINTPSGCAWTSAVVYPIPVFGNGAVTVGNTLYSFGGVSNGGYIANAYKFDGTTWTAIAPLPIALRFSAVVSDGTSVYIAGGRDAAGSARNTLYRYNPSANTYTTLLPSSTAAFGSAAVFLNGKIYKIAGQTNTTTTNVLEVYTIATNSWTNAGAVYPLSVVGLSAFAQNGFIYAAGGQDNAFVPTAKTYRYDPAANAWDDASIADLPATRVTAAAANYSGVSVLAGGYVGGNASANISASVIGWNALTNSWSSLRPMPLGVTEAAGAVLNGSLYVIGGQSQTTGVGTNNNQKLTCSASCSDYEITPSVGSILPGTLDIGNHCDDCTTAVALPFPVTFYGQSFTTANVSSNGNLQFVSNVSVPNTTLPVAFLNSAICPFWDDLTTSGGSNGIFTSITGTAPNRVLNIEWRASQFGTTNTINFELRLFEGTSKFEVIYGATTPGSAWSGTIGAQRDTGSLYTQFAGPNANPPSAGTRLIATTGCCPPIAFHGGIGFNSTTYPGTSGTQTNRVFRDLKPPSTCAAQKAYPGTTGSGMYGFDRYNFKNDGPATCVTFTVKTACAGTNSIFPVAYLDRFDPANIATNYLGDPGGSPNTNPNGESVSFSVNVPANSTVLLVVNEVTAGGGCPDYAVTVEGLNCGTDLSVTNTDSPDPVAGGGNITYAINVANNGPTDAANVTLSDTLPPNTTLVSYSTPTGWTASNGGGKFTATKASMAANTTAAFTLVVKVDANTVNGTVVNDTATVTTSSTDINPANNSASAATTVSNPCTLTCPANITVANDPNQCGAVVNYTTTSGTGGCGAITSSPASGSFFPKGTTTVTRTSASGSNCSFTVTVNDTQKPTVTCPANITTQAPPGQNSAVVNYPASTATDNCSGVTVSSSPASGSNFSVGTTTVTSTATDASGNTGTCTFTVTVQPAPTPTPTPVPTATPGPTARPSYLGNIATRLKVEAGDNTLIAGFIVTGPAGATKKVLIRGLGPTLAQFGVPGVLTDPFLELFDESNALITSNDDWQQGDTSQIPDSFKNIDPKEAIIVRTLTVGSSGTTRFTAVMKGANGETGVGLAEVYDLDTTSLATLGNLSTRGFVQQDDNVMIGGFFVSGTGSKKLAIRALGPTLRPFGISNPLEDPLLELHDGNGTTLLSNDNWQDTQGAEIQASGFAPQNASESVILTTLAPAGYTAIVRGVGNTVGVALVEVYTLN